MSPEKLILVDCPRDAIQGIHQHISKGKKADYINFLLEKAWFNWIDFGSFVSPKAVPQMADTLEVLELVNPNPKTKLLAIIANERGAETGAKQEKIDILGFPFSISEEFQQRNVNSGIQEAFLRLQNIFEICQSKEKELVVYISMGFGNPYREAWSKQLVADWIGRISEIGVKEFSLADTTGEASPELVKSVFGNTSEYFPELSIGVHLHSEPSQSLAKIKAAYDGGCRKFDGAVLGYGGCPFAKDNLVGNIPSEDLLMFFDKSSSEDIHLLKEKFRHLIS